MVYHVVPIPTAALVKCVEFLKCVRFRHDGYDLAVLIDAIQSIGFGGLPSIFNVVLRLASTIWREAGLPQQTL
jgi:hypothetical protein